MDRRLYVFRGHCAPCFYIGAPACRSIANNSSRPLCRLGAAQLSQLQQLCNACGVRFKKGKLVLFRGPGGGLTAVKQADAEPVVLPPPRKVSKKLQAAAAATTPCAPASAASIAKAAAVLARKTAKVQEAAAASAAAATAAAAAAVATASGDARKKAGDHRSSAPVVGGIRKISSDPALASMVNKRMRSRARRLTSGQAHGRYHATSPTPSVADTDTEYMQFLPSPSSRSSLCSLPTSPSAFDDGFSLRAASHHVPVDPHSESPYQFKDLDGEDAFPDLACLGIGSDADSRETRNALSLPTMAADPSSAEQFSFCDYDSAFGAPDPVLVADPLYQRTVLNSLIHDSSLPDGRLFNACTRALAQLCLRLLESRHSPSSAVTAFVRTFAEEQNLNSRYPDSPQCSMAARLLFPDRVVYDQAVDAFRAMCDCTNLAIFQLPLLLVVLEERVVSHLANLPSDFEAAGCAAIPCDTAGHSVPARA